MYTYILVYIFFQIFNSIDDNETESVRWLCIFPKLYEESIKIYLRKKKLISIRFSVYSGGRGGGGEEESKYTMASINT